MNKNIQDPLLEDESLKTRGRKKKIVDDQSKFEPSEEQVKTDIQDNIALTKANLDKEPKVDFIVPLMDGEQSGSCETVQINGYSYTVRKGDMVKIPLPVAQLLADKYRIQMDAGKEARIDRSSKVDKALN